MFPFLASCTDRETFAHLTGSIGADEQPKSYTTDGRQGDRYRSRRTTETECLLVSDAEHFGDVRASVGQGGGSSTARCLHQSGQGVRAIGPTGRTVHHLDTQSSGQLYLVRAHLSTEPDNTGCEPLVGYLHRWKTGVCLSYRRPDGGYGRGGEGRNARLATDGTHRNVLCATTCRPGREGA